jgi:nucleoside-diphosphate-sugar epimerase
MKKALIFGAGGFIGSHLAKRLKKDGYFVKGVDMRYPQFSDSHADEFVIGDLRDKNFCDNVFEAGYQKVYQLAADMGGAGYIFTGINDASIMSNSVRINLNVLEKAKTLRPESIFFASSACIYAEPSVYDSGIYAESSAYPALPDSEYGWEKLFSERLYLTFARNFGLKIFIARLHNVYGPESCWDGGREKVIAAICRKVISAPDHGSIQIWGDGQQTRSFLHIDECLEGIERLMSSSFREPLNIGSSEMVTVQALAQMIIGISGK